MGLAQYTVLARCYILYRERDTVFQRQIIDIRCWNSDKNYRHSKQNNFHILEKLFCERESAEKWLDGISRLISRRSPREPQYRRKLLWE